MASSLPKLRSDLTLSQHETAVGSSYVVKEPLSGNFFRFGEAEHFILQQFDGRTPIEAVRQRVEAKFEAELSVETLDAFIKNLERQDLLEREGRQKRKTPSPQRRVSGNLLHLRFKACDPTRLFDYLAPRLWFFFTPQFVILSAALIVLALSITIGHWNEFVRDLSRLYRIGAIPVLMVIVFLVVAAHEYAHGLTCRHFNGEVHTGEGALKDCNYGGGKTGEYHRH